MSDLLDDSAPAEEVRGAIADAQPMTSLDALLSSGFDSPGQSTRLLAPIDLQVIQHTSVGVSAIRRWLRPLAWQDAPGRLLPDELRDDYSEIPRRIDGVLVLPKRLDRDDLAKPSSLCIETLCDIT